MLFIDIETFSRTDIKAGVYRYSEDQDFGILMAAWAVDDGPVTVETDQDGIAQIPGLLDANVRKVAHNAQFERVCFSRFFGLPLDQFLPAGQWVDTAAMAGVLGWPQKLSNLADALGVSAKDSAGTRLINLFSKPNRKGERVTPADKPEQWAEFVRYCEQDVHVLREVYHTLGDGPDEAGSLGVEGPVWLADQAVNDRGIAIDVGLARRAVAADEDNRRRARAEMQRLTGLPNPGSVIQLLGWFRDTGLDLPDLRAATVTEALGRDDISDTHRRVLQLRQETALSAAKKFTAALDGVCSDGRLRGHLRYFGAHTGRWAGRGVQLQNLPRAQLRDAATAERAYAAGASEEAAETAAFEAMLGSVLLDLESGFGASAESLKALVRPMFTGPFTVVDYSAIEARVVAWLAGEQWVLDAFADGRDIYVETAKRMGHGMTRQSGKIASLALGYNGGPNALQIMAGAYGMRFDDDEARAIVQQWRRANPAIVRLWSDLDHAFRHGGRAGTHLTVSGGADTRSIRLPSGRSIHYRGVTFPTVTKHGRTEAGIAYIDPVKYPSRTYTYGGKLTENVTQAVARDILAAALVRLERAGYPVEGHVHDEILVHGHDLPGVSRLMIDPPAWAGGLPIAGAGFTTERYRKG